MRRRPIGHLLAKSSHGWLAIRFAHERGPLRIAGTSQRTRCGVVLTAFAGALPDLVGQPCAEQMGDAAQPRRRRRAAPRRTLSEQRTRRAATRRSTSRPANVCLRCIEKPSAVSGDRVRTVALSSMVLPCTASALAMYLRPASRRPAYQSAYVTRRARSRRRTPGQPIDRGDATAVDARRRREAALFEEVRAASPRSLMAMHFLAFRSV